MARPRPAKLVAPAKVNLFLGIGPGAGRLPRSHSILHAIALHDVLYCAVHPLPRIPARAGALAGPARNVRVRIECIAREGWPRCRWPRPRTSCFAAIDALAHEVGRTDEDAWNPA